MKKVISSIAVTALIISAVFAVAFASVNTSVILSSAAAADCTVKVDAASWYDQSEGSVYATSSDLLREGAMFRLSGTAAGTATGDDYLAYALPATKQLKVYGVVRKNSAVRLGFEISQDGVNWTKLDMDSSSVSRNANFDNCDYYGESETLFTYLRVIFSKKDYEPALCAIFVNPIEEPSPVTCEYRLLPNQNVAADSTATLTANAPEAGFYLFKNASGKSAAGTLTFKSDFAITDYNFRTLVSRAGAGGSVTFSASRDGVAFDSITPDVLEQRAHANASLEASYYYNYGTLDPEDGYLYLRAELNGTGESESLPALAYVEFNNKMPQMADSYAVKLKPDQNYAVNSTGTLVGNVSEIAGMYLFHDENSKTVDGTITFKSDYPIIDYRFRTVISTNNWGGYFTFSASSDGIAFVPLTPLVKEDGVHKSGWNTKYYFNYGAFEESDDIYYLRIEYHTTQVSIAKVPLLDYVQYNVTYPEIPTAWSVKTTPAQGVADSSNGTFKVHGEAGGYYMFLTEAGHSTAGTVIFASETPITAYRIRTLMGNSGYNGDISFFASSDGENYTQLTPVHILEKAHSNSAWAASYFIDYGFFGESENILYIKIQSNAKGSSKVIPAIGEVWYNCTGITPIPEPTYETLPESTPIDNLELPEKVTDFTGNSTASIFKKTGFNYTSNGTNADYIGGKNGLVAQAKEAEIIFYTPGIRDFTLAAVYTTGNFDKTEIKAYYWTEQYGTEVEIPLMRYLDPESQPTGFKRHIFRPADRDSLPDDIKYIIIRAKVNSPTMTQLLRFGFFYDGAAPGKVPADSQNPVNPNGTDRTNVKTYNFIKNNMQYVRMSNMLITNNAASNVDYIGTSRGIMTDIGGEDAFMVFRTDGITNFYLKVHMTKSMVDTLDLHIYLAGEDADEYYTEVPLEYVYCDTQPTGWVALEYLVEEGYNIPKGNNFLKVVVNGGNRSYQITRLDYEYEIPDAVPLPEYKQPDIAAGEKILEDHLIAGKLLKSEGGMAEEVFQMDWAMKDLGEGRDRDKILIKDNAIAESYIIYRVEELLSYIHIRGYRYKDAEEDLLISVSPDGEDWTLLEDFERAESQLFGGPIQYSHIIPFEDIPDGMNYIKIEIPELIQASDLVISDVYLLYGLARDGGTTGGTDGGTGGGNPDTGAVVSAGAALLALAMPPVAVAARKRKARIHR